MLDLPLHNNIVDDDVQFILQQIDILFDTHPGESIDPGYGTEYESLLYDTQISGDAIRDAIQHDLEIIDLRGWSFDVSVSLFEGTERDIALVNIDLYKDTDRVSKQYKIS